MGITRHRELVKRAQKRAAELVAKGWLEPEYEGIELELDVSAFEGHRVAIDFTGRIYAMYSNAHRNTLAETDILSTEVDENEVIKAYIKLAYGEILKFLRWKWHCVYVLDGPNKPKSKINKWNKNNEKKAKTDADISELEGKISECDPLDTDAISELEKQLRTKKGGRFDMPRGIDSILKDILANLGLPFVEADGDGEALCAKLCIDGVCEAAYSADTDTLVFGCPIWIKEVKAGVCTVIILEKFLNALGINYEQYVDICIAAGCDFNQQIYRFGICTAYDLIKQCQWIEALPDKYDITPLNHLECREIFKNVKILEGEDAIQNRLGYVTREAHDLRELLQSYGLSDRVTQFLELFKVVKALPCIESEKRDPYDIVVITD